MAAVGVSDHAGWAVLVTVTPAGGVVERRRVTLIDEGVPRLPHHHDAQGLPPDDGVELVARVRISIERCTRAALAVLAEQLPVAVTTIALRKCPALPPTVAERIASYRAQCVADSVMYRDVLADAAQARGWSVYWYDSKRVLADAVINGLLRDAGKSLGPPWTKDHRLAMAAAITANRESA
jgi:hypothetical protein